uniref:E3 ubiquitin-protein ligase UBR4 n=1 Tax=Tetraselmis sp. GSL018 TaxID=582737 RepID=A0A061RK46_9CHLO
MRVAGALFESLMEVVCPPKPEPSYLLVLEKAPTQEEFIRGYMNGNPYSSEEVGPLMRDVKNMICETLDMAGLVEDDYGMELLVAGRIISLSLPIRTVYERVWRANLISGQQGGGRLAEGSAEGPPMLVTYRLQGLDGEATEPMVSELEDVSAEDSSPEEEFRAATVLAEALSGGDGCAAGASSGVSLLIQQIAMLPPNAKEPSLSGLGCFGAFKAFAMRQRELVARLLHVAMYFRPCREAALREGALPKLLSSVHAGLRDLLGSAEQTPARQGGSARDLTAASSSRSTFATAEESLLLALEKLVEEAAAESFASLVARLTSSSSAAQGGPPVDSSVLLHQLAECLTGLVEAGHGNLCNILARVMPFLAAHNPSAQEALLDRFATSLDFYKLDEAAQASAGCPSQCELEYSSFLKLAEELGREGAVRPADPSSHGGAAGCASPGGSELGAAFMQLVLERGIPRQAAEYLLDVFGDIDGADESGGQRPALDEPPPPGPASTKTAKEPPASMPSSPSTPMGSPARVAESPSTHAYYSSISRRRYSRWASALEKPGVPAALRLLVALAKGHPVTARSLVGRSELLLLLHRLEGCSSENHVGGLAESLLETLSAAGGASAAAAVDALRESTKAEKKERAQRKREQMLASMGMKQVSSPSGQTILALSPGTEIAKAMEELEDEEQEDLCCMVCREGYKLRPAELLGAYCFCKRVHCPTAGGPGGRGPVAAPRRRRSARCRTSTSSTSAATLPPSRRTALCGSPSASGRGRPAATATRSATTSSRSPAPLCPPSPTRPAPPSSGTTSRPSAAALGGDRPEGPVEGLPSRTTQACRCRSWRGTSLCWWSGLRRAPRLAPTRGAAGASPTRGCSPTSSGSGGTRRGAPARAASTRTCRRSRPSRAPRPR